MPTITRVKRIANPRGSTRRTRKAPRRKATSRRRKNPVRVLTLGAANPRKKRTTKMATTRRRRRRANPVRRRRRATAAPRRRRRRSNPVATTRRRRTYRRRANPVRRRRRSTTRRRNPTLFGSRVSTTDMGTAVIGGLVGVTAAKMIPAMMPANLTATPIMRVITTGAAAYGASLLGRMVSPRVGDAMLFGGLMQTGSILLNAFLPTVGGHIGLSGTRGLGELMAGAYPVPQNPLNPMQANYPAYGRPAIADPASYGNGANVAMSGVTRGFARAF